MDNMIGQRIKDRRKELRITQTQIQNQTSVSSGNLSCIENGKYLPSAIALLELSRVLDCSVDWILTGKSYISKNLIDSDFLDSSEKKLLKYFHEMSELDQEDFLLIAEMKANKRKERHGTRSSHSSDDNAQIETA